LLDHYCASNLDHSKDQQEKHRRNDGEFDDSRTLSISSAWSASSLQFNLARRLVSADAAPLSGDCLIQLSPHGNAHGTRFV
jgi:hypothetical protein